MAADSSPIPRAQVRLSDESHRLFSTVADSTGRYLILIPNGSGIYDLNVRAFGYSPLTVLVQREPGTFRISRDLRLNAIAVSLQGVKVVAARKDMQRPTPGDRVENWQSFLSEALPIDPANLGAIAAMQPGVVPLSPDGSQLSIAGQAPDQNRTAVDGAEFGGSSLPSEAIRSVGLISNSYDVSQGGFSGGQIISRTTSGTNLWGGALDARVNGPGLNYSALSENAFANSRGLSVSTGGGGALKRDRLFVFGAMDASASRAPNLALSRLDSAAFVRLALPPDSVQRFFDIARRLAFDSQLSGALSNSDAKSASVLTRLDLVLSERQSLTARFDWRGSALSPFGSAPTSLTLGNEAFRTSSGGVLAQLSSTYESWGNELRAYTSTAYNRIDHSATRPSGNVDVQSLLADGSVATSGIGFGGVQASSLFPNISQVEIGDDAFFGTRSTSHDLRAGFRLQQQTARSRNTFNQFGTFSFASLSDLENGRAESFIRNFAGPSAPLLKRNGALYLGDAWRSAHGLGVVYGIRLDGSSYGARPPLPPSVGSFLSDGQVRPSPELAVSPRVGFRWGASSGNWDVDGGVGRFVGTTSAALLAPRWSQTGAGDSTLICRGASTPTPDWAAYALGSSAIPTQCAGGQSTFSSRTPSTLLFGPEFGASRNWRASLGVSKTLTPLSGVRFEALIVQSDHLPNATDENLSAVPRFGLADERGRPVFVDVGGIDPGTGQIAPGASRIDPSLGQVTLLRSLAKSHFAEVTSEINGQLASWNLSLSYTLAHARILSGGNPAPGAFGATTTSGDPGRLEWADQPFVPKHTLQIFASGYLARLHVSAIGRLSSGFGFTPMVGDDINGDGFANDRAYVFGGAGEPNSAIATELDRVRANAPVGARDCLNRQLGQIAGTATCRTGWSASLDLRGQMIAAGNINTRRLILAITASNVPAAFDYLLHGPKRLRGWGDPQFPDETLLRVRGFDPVSRAFMYDVNPNFGRPLPGTTNSPFRLTLEGRITLGSDPKYQPMMSAISAGMGNSRQTIRAKLGTLIHNIPEALLELSRQDSSALDLTFAQRFQLQAVADSLRPHFAEAIELLTESLNERGPVTAARQARLQERLQGVQALVKRSLDLTRAILTASQIEKIPSWLAREPKVEELQRIEFQVELSVTGGPTAIDTPTIGDA